VGRRLIGDMLAIPLPLVCALNGPVATPEGVAPDARELAAGLRAGGGLFIVIPIESHFTTGTEL